MPVFRLQNNPCEFLTHTQFEKTFLYQTPVIKPLVKNPPLTKRILNLA